VEQNRDRPRQLQHLVLASDADAFNLGGDLDVFSALIRARDADGLLRYARSCIDGVYRFHRGLNGDFRTIALLQGDALGGGLEMALSCHTIVAEEGVGMGLPEVLFGLFPGMGAYNFLSRRVSPQLAERIILELKDKIGGSSVELDFSGPAVASVPAAGNHAALANAALQELGYSPAEIATALKGADPNATTEELVRYALRAMVMKQ
jgi:enoyl-CoA hydratase/carnithine racemase